MVDPEYTLETLADLVQMQPRTVRSYIEQGLLRGPDTRGRNARYGPYHLKRLQVIKTLKEDYQLPLNEIRRLVTMAGLDEEIQVVPVAPGTAPRILGARQDASPPASPSTALEFIRARRSAPQAVRALLAAKTVASPRPSLAQDSPIERLLVSLREQVKGGKVQRKTRGQEWIRMEVTPDIEIHVRGQLGPEQLHAFEELADLIRHILLGGKDHE